ncbi:MAG: C1 family peptidase [Bacteroidales bacterium]|nr:C1 family peptidase [Bacteroidales bacterium]MBR6161834.1 C1 family peptidase [Bacteroidales bacterium]
MKKLFFVLLGCCTFLLVPAQTVTKNGGLSNDQLQSLKSSYKATASDKALRNAVVTNDINKLAKNYENATVFDAHFSNQVPSKAITDQESSGRCWMFTGMNVLRSKAIRKYNLPADFQFSQCYTFFWDQLEKSNLFLQAILDNRAKSMDDETVKWLFQNPLSDGGQFTGIANLVAKYGIMPKDAMPETYSSNHTSQISSLIKLKLREDALVLRDMANNKGTTEKMLQDKKMEMLQTVYRMLVIAFGEPPAEFTWTQRDAKGNVVSTETYTPKSFAAKFANDDFTTYYMVMNDPTREYYKVYEIEYDRHVYDGNNWKYLNLPMDEIAKMAIASLKDSTMMYFSCDVGKFLDRDKGYMDVNNFDYGSLFNTTFGMDKKQRIQTYASLSSHAMTLCAVDLDKDGNPLKWMVENSWGSKYGHNGFLIMTNEWFNEYMFRLVVEKKYIPAATLKLFDQKPIMLPAWDPLFAPEE